MTDSLPEIDGGIAFEGRIETSMACPETCNTEDFARDSIDMANSTLCQIYGGQVMAVAHVEVKCGGPQEEDVMPLENGSELVSYRCNADSMVSAYDASGELLHKVVVERSSSEQ